MDALWSDIISVFSLYFISYHSLKMCHESFACLCNIVPYANILDYPTAKLCNVMSSISCLVILYHVF
jgi:hypothetical protein